jgi:WD40 repeat protein
MVRYWEVPDLNPAGTGKGHSSIVTCCAITPDGSQLITGSNDTSIRIWNLKAGRASAVIRDAKTEVSACAILPDGSLFAAGSADGTIRLYRLPDGKPEGTIQVVPGKITSIVHLPDNELCIAGYENGSIAICSMKERRFIRSLPVHTAAVSGAALVSAGEYIATGGMDGMIRVTRLPWTKNLSRAGLDDLPWVYEETTGSGVAMRSEWTFLYRMLAGRFRGEIGICAPSHEAGPFDIQIEG